MADLTIGVDTQADSAITGFRNLGAEILSLAGSLKTLTDEASKQQRADVQLSAALKQVGYDTNTLLPALKAQATAFQTNLGVSDDMVESLQKLMIRYGTAPSDIEKTTQAILDYSAATGKDATSATEQLMKGIENGGRGLQRMGIHIDATGDKTKDLAQAVDQLANRWGGSAAAQADTFDGRLNQLHEQMGELKESFGQFVIDIDAKYHIIETLTAAVKAARDELFGKAAPTEADQRLSYEKALKQTRHELSDMQAQMDHDRALGFQVTEKDLAAEKEKLEEIARLKAAIAAAPTLGASKTGRGYETKGDKEEEQAHQRALEEEVRFRNKMGRIAAEEDAKASEEIEKRSRESEDAQIANEKEANELQQALLEERKQAHQETIDSELNAERAAGKAMDQASHERMMQLRKEESESAKIGQQIGSAFVTALASEIDKLSNGGEFDIADLVAIALQLAGTAVGAYFGGPAGAAIGGQLGGLAGSAVKNAAHKKHHDGGWIDAAPRYHSGGYAEVPAVLLEGERVLSHQEIRNMGGASAVDSAARGQQGGPVTLNFHIPSFDSRNVREFFGEEGGRGFYNALRVGRGPLAQAFGR